MRSGKWQIAYDLSTGLADISFAGKPLISNAYAEVEWRQGLNQATPGLANALTFLGQASSITSAGDR